MSYCNSCGSYIPDDQGSCCSMCYGDPYYGHDGYYLQWLEDQERIAQEKAYNERMLHEMEYERMKQEEIEE